MNFYKIPIDYLKTETKQAITIGFKLPLDHPLRQYRPGQYLTIRYHLKGESFLRCYSFCSLPEEEQICITIKKTKYGFISKELVNNAKLGMELEVGEPHGKFKVSPFNHQRRSHYFFAAGSGITPIISMIKQILEEEAGSNVYLIYSNSSEEDIIFKHQLSLMEDQFKNQLHIFYTLTQGYTPGWLKIFSKQTNWNGWKGRIDQPMIQKVFDQVKDSNKNKEFYLCGPGSFIQHIEKSLLDLQFDGKNIHKEYFNLSAADSTGEKLDQNQFKESQIKFTLNQKTNIITAHKGEKILDALMRSGYDPPYSCSSGVCSSCMAKLSSGTVSMDSDLALDKSDLEAGYILTCQSRCTSESVEINY